MPSRHLATCELLIIVLPAEDVSMCVNIVALVTAMLMLCVSTACLNALHYSAAIMSANHD